MKAIYYGAIPLDHNARKSRDPQNTTIMGANVYASDLFPALLRFSSYDRMFLPECPPSLKSTITNSPGVQAFQERLTFLPEHRARELRLADTVVYISPGQHIRSLARLREKVGHSEWPVTGVVHSLNYGAFQENIILDVLAPLRPHDAFFVSSTAGLTALSQQIAVVLAQLQPLSAEIAFRPQLRRIPLAVNEEEYKPASHASKYRAKELLGIPPDDLVILYLGRLSSTSKADLFPAISVFSQLVEVQRNVVFIIAGDDSHSRIRNALLAFADEMGCLHRVQVHADVSHEKKLEVLRAADMFLAPSDCIQETFGISLLEAMACGLPVIAADWSGYRDIVDDYETGMLIPTLMPDYPLCFNDLMSTGSMIADDLLARTTIIELGRLFDALLALVQNDQMRKMLGIAGRAKVLRSYTWGRVIKDYEEAWRSLNELGISNSRLKSSVSMAMVSNTTSFHQIYGHYATGALTLSDVIAPGPFIDRCNEAFFATMAAPAERFDIDLLRSLTDVVRGSSARSIQQTIGLVVKVRSLAPAVVDIYTWIFIHIARLIKYGCVSLKRATDL